MWWPQSLGSRPKARRSSIGNPFKRCGRLARRSLRVEPLEHRRLLAVGINVTQADHLFTIEDGTTAQFFVTLTGPSAPTDDVTVSVESSDATEGTVSIDALTFTDSTWNVPQTVTVMGVDDDVADRQQPYTVSLLSTSLDPQYLGRYAQVSLSNLDDDAPGIAIVPAGILVTSENVDASTFKVFLSTQPTTDVTVNVSSSDDTIGTASPDTHTFDAGNWDQPWEVTVTGVNDSPDTIDPSGYTEYSVFVSAAGSDDADYAALPQSEVSFLNRDNDAIPGITVAPTTGLVTSEGGARATFTVVLDTMPTDPVTIPIKVSPQGNGAFEGKLSKDGSTFTTSIKLTFDTTNWSVPQEVVVQGEDDESIGNPEDPQTTYYIVVGSPVTDDDDYAALDPEMVTLMNADNDSTDPDVLDFMETFTWWALESQREMAIGEPLSNVMHLAAHNAFNTVKDGFLQIPGKNPNQIYRMPDQLDLGVRVLDLDFHNMTTGTEVWLSHNIPTISDARRLSHALTNDLVPWINRPENRDEVIILVIEDKYDHDDSKWIQMLITAFGDKLQWMSIPDGAPQGQFQDAFNPAALRKVVEGRQVWKSRRELVDEGIQVIVGFFSDFEDASNVPGTESLDKFTEVRGDGHLSGNPPITKEKLEEQARKNINSIPMDFILGKEGQRGYPHKVGTPYFLHLTDNPESDMPLLEYPPIPAPFVGAVVGPSLVDLPTKHDGERGDRLAAAVWSWGVDTPGPFRARDYQDNIEITDQKDVVIQGADSDPSRWKSVEPNGGEAYTFALRSIDRFDANGNVNPVDGNYGWKVSTFESENWADYRQVAEDELFDPGDDVPDWLFAGPINGLQNWNLYEARVAGAVSPWLNVHDFDQDGDWTVDATPLALTRDEFEDNDTLDTATVLGSVPQMTFRDLTIHHYTDDDYYQLTAPQTGKLLVDIHFAHDEGNLDLQILDGYGNVIDSSQSETDDEQLVIPVVAQQRYYVYVDSPEGDINWYDLEIENYPAPIPSGGFLDPASDSGRSNADNITNVSRPQVFIQADVLNFVDTNNNDTRDADEITPFTATQAAAANTPGAAVQVWLTNTTTRTTVKGFADPFSMSDPVFYSFTPAANLADGMYVVNAATWIFDGQQDASGDPASASGRTLLSDILFDFTIDTAAPPVSITGIAPFSTDTGVDGQASTFSDRITSDTATGFLGRAEADAIVRLYVDPTSDDAIGNPAEYSLTVAVPEDGNLAFPDGQWNTAFIRDLNDPGFFPLDGIREVAATAEDVAGNVSEPDFLDVFIDTAGPQVTGVSIVGDPGYNLFDQKDSPDGRLVPTPLVYSLAIDVQDLPDRAVGFLHEALVEGVALNPGHYLLVGDANGIIPIAGVSVTNDPRTAGDPATATIVLSFADPLPDDRFTLSISDSLVDPPGNALDGENNAVEPQDPPLFPTGDGVPGGDFVARFTVDSRPELGCWAAGSVYVDTNGNFSFDPENVDFTNRDIVYTLGFTSDDVFAGNFALNPGDTADGFDKLAAYGRVGSSYRWLVDTDNDGVPNVVVDDPKNINGLPVAGDFDGNPVNGDEVGLFTGTTWWLDTDHDFAVDTAVPAPLASSDLRGYPVVGDFNGDGADDLATWSEDTFYLDLDFDGLEDTRFTFGMIGVRERPVAADMDQDGIDDLGLWVPDRSGALPEESSEWYFLVSAGRSILDRIVPDPGNWVGNVVHFTPVPFGSDIYARFGDEFAIPVVGNFDPPVAGGDAGRSDPGIVHLRGTAGADEFDFRPGATPGSWLVTLNGDQQHIAAASVTVTFNGLGGNDIATITSTDGNERAVFDAGSASLTQPGLLALSVTNVERISIDGGGGSDTAILRDSNQNDSFVGRTNSGKLTYDNNPQCYAEALDFSSIVAVARYGGTDTADLHGSDGNDIFVGRTGWSTLRDRDPSGGDYRLSAKFFETTTAHGELGTDQAFLHDSNRDDHFEGTADYGRLEFGDAPNHAVQANGFSFVMAYARAGGTDTGNLSGSDGNEKFVGRQTWSKLRSQDPSASGAYSHLLKFFETVTATAGNGGTDYAWLFGSLGNDTLVATPASTTLSGWRFSNTVQGFPNVGARGGGGGNDDAYLFADGHDHLLAHGKLAQLTWDDTWVLSAYGFDYVEADGNEGEHNTREKILPIDYVLAATDDWDLL